MITLAEVKGVASFVFKWLHFICEVVSELVLIVKFLQFQPEVQQKFFNWRRFDFSVVADSNPKFSRSSLIVDVSTTVL